VDDLTRFDRSHAFDEWGSYGQANVVGGDDGPPALTLQHELSHAWDHLHNSAIDIGGPTPRPATSPTATPRTGSLPAPS
ncbi:MAG TPA: hypothetical protein VFZ30_04635, partial [Acidimicrobiales bacterium]